MKKRVNFPCPDVLKTFSDAKLVSRTLFIPNRVSYSDRVYQFKIPFQLLSTSFSQTPFIDSILEKLWLCRRGR